MRSPSQSRSLFLIVVLPCDSAFFNSALSETDPPPRSEIVRCQHDHHFTDVVENESKCRQNIVDFIKPITGLIDYGRIVNISIKRNASRFCFVQNCDSSHSVGHAVGTFERHLTAADPHVRVPAAGTRT